MKSIRKTELAILNEVRDYLIQSNAPQDIQEPFCAYVESMTEKNRRAAAATLERVRRFRARQKEKKNQEKKG